MGFGYQSSGSEMAKSLWLRIHDPSLNFDESKGLLQ